MHLPAWPPPWRRSPCSRPAAPPAALARAGPATPSLPARRSRAVRRPGRLLHAPGPLIPTTDLAGGCARSDHNYPSLVAERLNVEDVRRRDLQRRDHPRPDPRAARPSATPGSRRSCGAVTPDTDLVTLGIGGNDFDLFSHPGRHLHAAARLGPARARRAPGGSPRAAPTWTRPPARSADRVAAALRGDPAPGPAGHGGAGRLPAAGPRPRHLRRSCRWRPATTPRAGGSARCSTGRCSGPRGGPGRRSSTCTPPPAGTTSARRTRGSTARSTDRQRALAYHPFASGMRADARRRRPLTAVGRRLTRSSRRLGA